MQIAFHNIYEAQGQLAKIVGERVTIGRDPANDIVLPSPFVAMQAAVLDLTERGWRVIAMGKNGCEVNGKRLRPGEFAAVSPADPIHIFPYTITLDGESDQHSRFEGASQLDLAVSKFVADAHCELLARMNLNESGSQHGDDIEFVLTMERQLEDIARVQGIDEFENSELQAHLAGYSIRGELIEMLMKGDSRQMSALLNRSAAWMKFVTAHPEREFDVQRLVREIERICALDELADHTEKMNRIDASFWKEWEILNAELLPEFRLYLALREVKKQVKDLVMGYGPLEDLLRAPNISEVLVVSSDRIYIEKNGVIENSGRRFISDRMTEAVIERIVSQVGRTIDKSRPLVDARLSDGSRVNAVIEPLAVSGPCLTIRKFPLERITMEDLVSYGALTPTLSKFLQAAVIAKCNILIAGGTGTGKTTLLNCLANFIPDKERIVTIEDTAELQIPKEHVVRLETKQANAEGKGAYEIRDLVVNSLRMRPDRVIVGECRKGEALDMLQAMNTGHDGSMTTIHANNPRNVVERLEVMVQMAANLPVSSIHRQVASAIDLVVQLKRHKNRRWITHVTEIVDVEKDGSGLRTRDLFLADPHNPHSIIAPTGVLPSFMPRMLQSGLWGTHNEQQVLDTDAVNEALKATLTEIFSNS